MRSPYCAELASRVNLNESQPASRGLECAPARRSGRIDDFLALAVTPEAAEPVSPTADARGTLDAPPTNATRPLRSGGANQIPAHGAPIVLEINKGTLIRLTAPAATVFIANPDVADV